MPWPIMTRSDLELAQQQDQSITTIMQLMEKYPVKPGARILSLTVTMSKDYGGNGAA